MLFEFDDITKKKLENLLFVEAASNNLETQTALLETLETDENMKGRFKNSTDMFTHMQQEWDNE